MDIDKALARKIELIDARMGTSSTEEQKLLSCDFTKPLISFSNPGTGKTYSVIKGLILANTYYGIPGEKINAMSFTTEATTELAMRYENACKSCGVKATIKFNTFHRLCRLILLERYPGAKIVQDHNEEDYNALDAYMKEEGIADTDGGWFKKRIMKAIDHLNHSLVYEEEHVEMTFIFKELNIDVQSFQVLRKKMFRNMLQRGKIPQGDIPTVALYVLLNNPSIAKKYKAMHKIMVVDEFQDMTKLYLVILSIISMNLVVIGDMKQQIYGFNGACDEIVSEYLKMFPDARQVELTNSFRCKNEIAEFATEIYRPNNTRIKSFIGVGTGGKVSIVKDSNLSFEKIVASIKEEEKKSVELYEARCLGMDITGKEKGRTTMFLCRNNFSITPIVEELFQQNIPYLVKKFKKVMDLPIYNELSKFVYAILHPDDLAAVAQATYLFPEIRGYNSYENIFVEALRKANAKRARNCPKINMFDLPFEFRQQSSNDIFRTLSRARKLVQKCAKALEVYQCLMPIYENHIIEGKWWKLDMPKEFYDGLVYPIISKKTVEEMWAEEVEKENRVAKYMNAGVGVKCYTAHSAKGLEADDVYILDAESAFYPAKKHIKKLIDAGCLYDAARLVREERNLLYVGITRARSNCYITYSEELTPLISKPEKNKFSYLDDVYESSRISYDDVGAFMELLNLSEKGKSLLGNIESKTELDSLEDVNLDLELV